MENRKVNKILIVFVIFLTFLYVIFSLFKNDFVYYIVGYRHIKHDLYRKNDSIYILKKATWYEGNDTLEFRNYEDNVIFKNSNKKLIQIIDVNTFHNYKDFYYDKNNIYFFNSKPFLSPTLNAISSKSKKLKSFCCDYVSTDNKIFFQSKEIINVDINTFKVTDETRDGYYFAKDKNNYYYKDSIVCIEYFNEVKNAIK